MNKRNLTFALIQTNLIWENKIKNLSHFNDKINSIDFKFDVAILPEMFTTGFTMNAKDLAEDMAGPTMEWLKEITSRKGIILVGSFIAKEKGRYFNRLIWMRPDGSYDYYDKKHLFRMADEDNFYASGNSCLTVELHGWKIRPLICYDLRFPVWSRNRYNVDNEHPIPDYDLLIYVANWPSARSLPWDILLRARAVENQTYCIGLNRIGEDDKGNSYAGHSTVINPKGEYLLNPVKNSDGIFKVELDYETLQNFREKFPVGLDADNFTLTD